MKRSDNALPAGTVAFEVKRLFAKNKYFSVRTKLFFLRNQLLKQKILGILFFSLSLSLAQPNYGAT